MSRPPTISVADARRTYDSAKRWSELEGDWPSFVLYRPISLWLTPLAVRLGVSARAATLAAATLAVSLPFLARFGGDNGYLLIAACVFVIHVFDCLDGNIARVTGTASKQGALLDGFADLCFWSLYFAAIGLLADRSPTSVLGGHGVTVALAAAVLVLLNRLLRESFATLFGRRAEFMPASPPRLSLRQKARIGFISLERLYVFALVIGGAVDRMDVVLIGIAAYVSLIFAGALFVTFGAARKR